MKKQDRSSNDRLLSWNINRILLCILHSTYHPQLYRFLLWTGFLMLHKLTIDFLPFLLLGSWWDSGNCENRAVGRRLLHLHKFCEQIKLLCRRRNSHHCPLGQVTVYHCAFVLRIFNLTVYEREGVEGEKERERLSADLGLLLNKLLL